MSLELELAQYPIQICFTWAWQKAIDTMEFNEAIDLRGEIQNCREFISCYETGTHTHGKIFTPYREREICPGF